MTVPMVVMGVPFLRSPILSHTPLSFFGLLLLLLNCPIQFVSSENGTDQPTTLWTDFYQNYKNELPEAERTEDNLELFAEMDAVDTVLTDGMAKVMPVPPSPAHPAFQELYLDKKEKERSFSVGKKKERNDQQSGSKKEGKWQRVRSFFTPRAHLLKRSERIVKTLQELVKDSRPGGWGQLVQRMYADMVQAKQTGKANVEGLHDNCQTALRLLTDEEKKNEGGTLIKGVKLEEVKPFDNLWSLIKSAAKSMLALFKGSAGSKETTTLVRVLKTFAQPDTTAIFAQIGGPNVRRHRRRRKRFVLGGLEIVGIILGCGFVLALIAMLVKA